jgi:hypothetical protein
MENYSQAASDSRIWELLTNPWELFFQPPIFISILNSHRCVEFKIVNSKLLLVLQLDMHTKSHT